MDYQYLLYSKEESIGIVTVNRPDSLNALSNGVYSELRDIFQEIEDDPDVRVAIITGSGEKAFIAGADIADMKPRDTVQIRSFSATGRSAADRIYSLSKPVIAAVKGYALGGGLELAMCCDLIIAAENARFGQPEINLAIIPGGGGTQRLPRIVGMTRAKGLIYTGDMIDANTALAWGLVNKVVPADSLMAEAKELARKLLSKSSIALERAKKAITTGANMDLASGVDFEEQCFSLCFGTEDQKEGMGAFLEKRKPQFKGK